MATADERRELQAEIVERVRQAIEQLPRAQREVLTLHKLRGMPMAKVAQHLNIREGAVRVRAHRGYKSLARLLGAGTSVWLFHTLGDPHKVLGAWS